jgi:hypothetical protein
MIEQTNALLNHEWTPDERVLIKRLVDSLLYYKYLIPKNLKSDVVAILDMANNIKHEYTILKNTSSTTGTLATGTLATGTLATDTTTCTTITTGTLETTCTTIILIKRRNSCLF